MGWDGAPHLTSPDYTRHTAQGHRARTTPRTGHRHPHLVRPFEPASLLLLCAARHVDLAGPCFLHLSTVCATPPIRETSRCMTYRVMTSRCREGAYAPAFELALGWMPDLMAQQEVLVYRGTLHDCSRRRRSLGLFVLCFVSALPHVEVQLECRPHRCFIGDVLG